MLLRPKANVSDLTGELTRIGADGREYLIFRYTVIRLWEAPAGPLLAGGLGTVPLAMLTDEAVVDLVGTFTRFTDRLRQPDVDAKLAKELLGSTFVLCGLRHESERVAELYRSLSMTLEDSTTYQLILNKGRAEGKAEEARRLILIQGHKRFGQTPETAEAILARIADPSQLERMAERIFDAASWDDLLATP